jgi:hypothetical protein
MFSLAQPWMRFLGGARYDVEMDDEERSLIDSPYKHRAARDNRFNSVEGGDNTKPNLWILNAIIFDSQIKKFRNRGRQRVRC